MNKHTIMICIDGDVITYYSRFVPAIGDELVLKRGMGSTKQKDIRVRVTGRLIVANNDGEDTTVELDCEWGG